MPRGGTGHSVRQTGNDIPQEWTASAHEVKLTVLKSDSKEYLDVEKAFYSTVTDFKIKKVHFTFSPMK